MPSSPVVITLDVDSSKLIAALDELAVFLAAKPHIAQLLRNVRLFCQESVKTEGEAMSTNGTRVIRLLLEPSDCLSELLTAFRAGNFDANIIERIVHEGSSIKRGMSCGDSNSTSDGGNSRSEESLDDRIARVADERIQASLKQGGSPWCQGIR